MTAFLAASATLVLSCGLNATPDGQKPPNGDVVMVNAPIPANLAESLASGSPPSAKMKFDDAQTPMPGLEWIIGLRTDPARGTLLARLSRDIFGFKVRFGWASVNTDTDGFYAFGQTAAGTCQIKDATSMTQKAAQ